MIKSRITLLALILFLFSFHLSCILASDSADVSSRIDQSSQSPHNRKHGREGYTVENDEEQSLIVQEGACLSTVKIYHLRNIPDWDYSEYLLEENTTQNFDYEEIPCVVNIGEGTWFRRQQTKSKPKAWKVISEGTGKDIWGENYSNTGEHWVYFIERNEERFAISFGHGVFLKKEGIDENFGRSIVKNIVAKPSRGKEDCLEGIPISGFGSYVKGKDYCSLKRSVYLSYIPRLCIKLLRYAESKTYEVFQSIQEKHSLIKVDDSKTPKSAASLENGESLEIDGQPYIKFFDEIFKFNPEHDKALRDYVTQLLTPQTEHTEFVPIQEGEDEGKYNQRIEGANHDSLFLMDKKLVKKTEVCDLFSLKIPRLFHVKIGTQSHLLNHLFGQGNASAELLKNDEEFRKKLPDDIVRLSLLDFLREFFQKSITKDKQVLLERLRAFNESIPKQKDFTKLVCEADRKLLQAVADQLIQDKEEITLTRFGKLVKTMSRLNKTSPFKSEHSANYNETRSNLKAFCDPRDYDSLRDKIKIIFEKDKPLEQKLIELRKEISKYKTVINNETLIDEKLKDLSTTHNALKKFVDEFKSETTTIVFVIGVPTVQYEQEEEKAKLIPLGARINLKTYAENLMNSGKGFKIKVKFVPDLNKNIRTKDNEEELVHARTASEKVTTPPKKQKSTSKNISSDNDIRNLFGPVPIKERFERNHRNNFSKLQPYIKVNVSYGVNKPLFPALYDYYIVGPTLRDGDCFFHATFTKDGQNEEAAIKQAEGLRSSLGRIIMGSEKYKTIMKKEYLGYIRNEFLAEKEVLSAVEMKLRENEFYGKARESAVTYLSVVLSNELYKKNYFKLSSQEKETVMDQAVAKLPDSLKATEHHTDDKILKEIRDEDLNTYIKRYEKNIGLMSYIEIPVGQYHKVSIANVIAEENKLLIHCFLFDAKNRRLNYSGSVGDSTSFTEVISILLDISGTHYWTLYHPDMPESRKKGIIQAAENAKSQENPTN